MDLQPLHLANERVQLLPLKESDFEDLYAVASDPLIWEQHPNPDRYKRDVFLVYFRGAMESGGAFLIRDLQTGKIAGSSRYYDYNAESGEVKIGYTFFSRECWGGSVNPAVKQLMIDHAFRYVGSVFFEVGATNIRSQKAMERLGAVKTGERAVAYYGEPPKINFIYRIDKADWEHNAPAG